MGGRVYIISSANISSATFLERYLRGLHESSLKQFLSREDVTLVSCILIMQLVRKTDFLVRVPFADDENSLVVAQNEIDAFPCKSIVKVKISANSVADDISI